MIFARCQLLLEQLGLVPFAPAPSATILIKKKKKAKSFQVAPVRVSLGKFVSAPGRFLAVQTQ